jgi:hypothetical protein
MTHKFSASKTRSADCHSQLFVWQTGQFTVSMASIRIRIEDRFGDVDFNLFQADFRFIIGGHSYVCSKVAACFLSPVVNNLIRNDSTMQEIQLNTRDDQCLFPNIISLGHGQLLGSNSLDIDRDFYLSISRELQIHEIAEGLLNDNVDLSLLSLGELLYRCENRSLYGLDCPDEIATIARRISVFNSDGLIFTIPLNILESVLSHPELAVSGEDQLCAYLAKRCESDPEVISMFQYVQFRYLSASGVNIFIEAMGDSWRHMTDSTWQQFCERARCPIEFDFDNNWTGARYSGTSPADGETFLGLLARLHG